MDNLINEYNNLWNKLNKITEYHNNLFLFSLTSSGAILTYSIKQKNEYITLVNMLILILLKCRVMYYRDEYFSIQAYIRAILEPQLGINSRLGFGAPRSKVSHIHYFVYSILGFGTTFTSFYIYMWISEEQCEANIVILLLTFLLLIVVIVLDCYYLLYANKLYRKYYTAYYRKFISYKRMFDA